MTQYRQEILRSFAATLIPRTGFLTETPDEIGLVERVERYLGFLPKNLQILFAAALLLFEFLALLYRGHRFTRLSVFGQERYLERWQNSFFYPVRLLFRFLESICYLNYYSHPAICKKLGFTPPPIRQRVDPPRFFTAPAEDLFLKTDVCIVGSGAGGAVAAAGLAEKGRSVVILEEGGWFNINDFGKEPLEIVQKIYRNAGLQVTVGFPGILVPTGRAVGGTTIINSGTCFRLPDKVLSRWQKEFGLTDLTPAALAPYFDRVERQIHVEPVGEEILGNSARLFRMGLEKLGRKGEPLRRNVRDCRGSGMCCFGCPTDAKQSVHLSYLPQAIEKGAKLFIHCRVESVFPKLAHGGEVVGYFLDPATGSKTKRTIRVEAKVVVLSAGTLATPGLLRKNQIAIHNRHVGRHLTIHPASKVAALFEEEVRGWEGVPQGFSYDGLSDDGILFEGVFTPPSYGAVAVNLPPRLHKEMMERYAHLASFGFMVTDEGRGWIRWLPNGDPIIYYSLRRREVRKFVKATRFMAEVFLMAGAKKIFTGFPQLPVVTSEVDLRALDRITVRRNDLQLAAFHPLGTCRMGADPGQSVVNGFGEVHGMGNLFIADGSIFPSPLGVNPQETIMAFAARTADFIDRERL